MFVIYEKKLSGSIWSEWFPIWHSDDGHDSSDYLAELDRLETERPARTYKMVWERKK